MPAWLTGKVAKLVAVLLVAGGILTYVMVLRAQNAELREAVTIHERNAEVYQSVIAKEKAARARQVAEIRANAEALEESERRAQAAWQTVRAVQRKYAEHDLEAMAKDHPEMLANRIEAGTEALFSEWEKLANSP